MARFIALFRGINVGGKHIIKMQALRDLIQQYGYTEVNSYIQSGNVVFRSSDAEAEGFSDRIGEVILDQYGFRPRILVLGAEKMKRVIEANPYPEAVEEPKTLHLYFLAEPCTSPDLEALEALKKENEAFYLSDEAFYLHAPDGIGRSKLADKIERCLGVQATARNWRTTMKVWEMVEG